MNFLSPRRVVVPRVAGANAIPLRVPETFGGRTVRIPSIFECIALAVLYGLSAFSVASLVEVAVHHHFQPIGQLVAAIFIGVVMFNVLYQNRLRKQFALYRFSLIGEANHHIRNAMQTIVYLNHGAPEFETVREQVSRIQWVLEEILPEIAKDEADDERNAEQSIHQQAAAD